MVLSEAMLVRDILEAAQNFPRRTFASASLKVLHEIGVPEVFNFAGWDKFVQTGDSVLPA